MKQKGPQKKSFPQPIAPEMQPSRVNRTKSAKAITGNTKNTFIISALFMVLSFYKDNERTFIMQIKTLLF